MDGEPFALLRRRVMGERESRRTHPRSKQAAELPRLWRGGGVLAPGPVFNPGNYTVNLLRPTALSASLNAPSSRSVDRYRAPRRRTVRTPGPSCVSGRFSGRVTQRLLDVLIIVSRRSSHPELARPVERCMNVCRLSTGEAQRPHSSGMPTVSAAASATRVKAGLRPGAVCQFVRCRLTGVLNPSAMLAVRINSLAEEGDTTPRCPY